MAYTKVTTDYVLDNPWGYQSANRDKDNIRALLGWRPEKQLGGSRHVGLQAPSGGGAVAYDAYEFRDVVIDGSAISGDLVFQARVEVKTANAAMAVTPTIRNVTLGADAIVGSSSASTSFVEQTLVLTPAAGVNRYRLQLTPATDAYECFGFGVIEVLES